MRHLQLVSAAADVFPKAIAELAGAITSALMPARIDRRKRSSLTDESIGQI